MGLWGEKNRNKGGVGGFFFFLLLLVFNDVKNLSLGNLRERLSNPTARLNTPAWCETELPSLSAVGLICELDSL